MCTEVKHGPHPQWDTEVSGWFSARVVGRYTTQNHLIAAGVLDHCYHSNRSEKQMAELLGLRTAFLDWFFTEYERLGGTRDEAIEQVVGLCKHRLDRMRCIPTNDDGERIVTEAEYAELVAQFAETLKLGNAAAIDAALVVIRRDAERNC